MNRAEINAYVEECAGIDLDELVLLLDGLDEAFIGLTTDSSRAVYDVDKIIKCLSKDMSEEAAWEYYEYNIECAYVGENTPLYVKLVKYEN
jgi:hypothetical protein